ncbi:hypothetical protein G3N95_24055 [Paraburkholderia sp. Tr-20389]|uniref:hypothetical protein n=1 Tax=Paraburkholderia sp. Tr-20389 TaxID=2703903 RepID=UPI00197E0030|nr:hypothetical protein [Paraburkholderia sp. Tr-20389]MBN3756037.1 hypothetical protein [Paraburkholderia sp. Tr-20389]
MKPGVKSIDARWNDFSARHIAYASPAVVHDLRIAFYAGFKAMLDANLEIAELDEASAVLELEGLHIESHRFGASL